VSVTRVDRSQVIKQVLSYGFKALRYGRDVVEGGRNITLRSGGVVAALSFGNSMAYLTGWQLQPGAQITPSPNSSVAPIPAEVG